VKSKLFRNASLLTISQFTTMAVPLLSGIWIAGQLSEQEFGAYRLLLILITYLTYSTLGAELRLMYQFPEAIGRGAQIEIEKMPSTLHSILVLNRSVIFVIALCLALFDFKLNGISIGLGWVVLSIGFAIDGWGNLYEMVIRSFQKFMQLSVIRVSGALCYLLFLFVFLKMLGFGISGILISLSLSGVVKILLARNWSKLKLRFGVTTIEIIEFVKYGFPLKINSLIWTLLISVNIWLVSYYLSPKDAGILGYAMMTSGAFSAAAAVFTEILSVRFIQYSGRCTVNGNTNDRFHATYSASVGWAGLNLLIAISALAIFSLVITLYMPKYSSAWGIIIINMIGYYVYSIIDTIGNSEIISGRAKNLTKLFSIFFVIELIASVVVCKLYPTLEHIAIVQTICLTLLAGSVAYQHWKLDISESANKKRFLKLAILVAAGVAILVSSRYIVSLEMGLAGLVQSLIILLILTTPILWFSYRGFVTFYGHVSQVDLK
jgi:O-antigen/teichoic acid export membrane protein